ncbi:MAG: transcription antitermination factor NusB [Candidatus Aadella gelida]|nr:transcription antitermination factor NusB [Candidatus Aadella gelida]
MRKRTVSRELALKILYARDITKESVGETDEKFWEHNAGRSQSIREFTEHLVFGVDGKMKDIDSVISACSTNWDLDRMATIDRNILRIAVYELTCDAETPPKVVINEAIEMAKKYGDENSGSFVNGILDEIKKRKKINDEKSR